MSAQKNREEYQAYRKALVKSYYRVSCLEKLLSQVGRDKTIGAALRDELTRLIEQRIETLVESRLASVN